MPIKMSKEKSYSDLTGGGSSPGLEKKPSKMMISEAFKLTLISSLLTFDFD